MNKDAFYFPHFCNARHDRKIKRLMKELGVEGYGIFFMVLEILREQLDFRYPISDIDLLVDEFGTSEAKIKAVINSYCLFEVDNENFFYSPKFNEYMQPYLKMKEQRVLAGKKSAEARKQKYLEPPKNDEYSTTVQQPFNDRSTTDEQSKVNKVKESKVNKENKEIHSAFFESVWLLYPEKKGKAAVSEKQMKELERIGYTNIVRCINRYKKDKPEWKQWQNGSTFFNKGYIDYLDSNYSEANGDSKFNPYKEVT